MTTLGRFISYSAKRCLPFFKALKGKIKLVWGEECVEVFSNLKTFLSFPSLLTLPIEGEVLYLYLSVMQKIISSMLVREDEGE